MYPDCWNCNMDCSIHECDQKKRDILAQREVFTKKDKKTTPGKSLSSDCYAPNLLLIDMKRREHGGNG